MKYCDKYGPLLDAYVDGELSPADTLRTAEHLKTCEDCRAYVDAALAIRAAFPSDAEEPEVPAEFAAGVLSAIRAGTAPQAHTPPAKRREFRWKRLALPLAACLALAVFAAQAGWGSVRDNFQANAAAVRDSGSPKAAQADGAALQEASTEEKTQITGGADADLFKEYVKAASDEAEAPAPDPGEAEASADSDAAGSTSYYDYTARNAALFPPMLSASAPASAPARTEALEDKSEAGAENQAEKQAENAVTVTLTPDQGGALADVLAGCTLEHMDDDGGYAVYLLTADRFEAVLAELERLNIPASVAEADASAEYRLYVQYRAFP